MLEISKEKFYNLDIVLIYSILDKIGVDIIRNIFIKEAQNLPKKSKYYKGKPGNGDFWNGFRENQISLQKIKTMFKQELSRENSEIKLDIIVHFAIIQKLDFPNNEDEFIKRINESELEGNSSVIFDLYGISVDESLILQKKIEQIKINHSIEIDKLKDEYQLQMKIDSEKQLGIIKQLEENNKKIIKENGELKNKIIALETTNHSYMLEIDKLQECLNNSNEKISFDEMYEKISKKCNDKIEITGVVEEILKCGLDKRSLVEKYLKKNIDFFENLLYDDLKKNLIIEYIIIRMLEE